MIRIVSFTVRGARLCARLVEKLEGEGVGYAPERYCMSVLKPLAQPVGLWAEELFFREEALVFIGAAGIAVRAIAPLVASKGSDPAVVCLDEKGQYVIPLLSGHIGGANNLARRLAGITGGSAVITTATDVQGYFSPDSWAAGNGCVIPRLDEVKYISSALLDEETVGLYSDFPVDGPLPKGLRAGRKSRCGILISLSYRQQFPHTLWMVPKCLRVGVGCKKDTGEEEIRQAVFAALSLQKLPLEAVSAVATIDLKAEEAGLLGFCSSSSLPLETYSPQQLEQVEGSNASSGFVRRITGVDNVCERAALAEGGMLVVGKTSGNGVAVAVAMQDWRARFA